MRLCCLYPTIPATRVIADERDKGKFIDDVLSKLKHETFPPGGGRTPYVLSGAWDSQGQDQGPSSPAIVSSGAVSQRWMCSRARLKWAQGRRLEKLH